MAGNCKIIMDMHSAAFDRPWTYLAPLTKWAMRRASAIMVHTSEAVQCIPIEFRGKTITLEDKVPDLETITATSKTKSNAQNSDSGMKYAEPFKIAAVCSFAPDEPLKEIVAAASAMPEVKFFITGDSSRIDKKILVNAKKNIVFTGFMAYDEYVSLLASVDAVMVLTKRENSSLAGAYEAVALQKPLITSKSTSLTRSFYKGSVFVDNSSEQIQQAIEIIRGRSMEITQEIVSLREEKIKSWNEDIQGLRSLVLQ
jgi:glycosyltransferase involved in cell wall biosynthesis